MSTTTEELRKILSYIGELSVKHDAEVKDLKRKIQDLTDEFSEWQTSNYILIGEIKELESCNIVLEAEYERLMTNPETVKEVA